MLGLCGYNQNLSKNVNYCISLFVLQVYFFKYCLWKIEFPKSVYTFKIILYLFYT